MKRKIALFLALALASPLALASCSKKPCETHVDADIDEVCDVCGEHVKYEPTYLAFDGTFNGNYQSEDADAIKVFGKTSLVSELNDMELDESVGDLMLFTNYSADAGEAKGIVLNTKTGAIVYTLKKEDDGADVFFSLEIDEIGDESFIMVTKTDRTDADKTVYTKTVYTALGTEIASKQTNGYMGVSFVTYTSLTHDSGLYLIDGKVYEIKDSVATYKFDKGLASLPSSYNYYPTANYYYCRSNEELFVYDTQFNLVAYYSLPAGCEFYSSYCVFDDGNVLIQYVKELPEDAAEYDLYEDGTKYTFGSVIFNVADGTSKAVELDYVVESVLSTATYPMLADVIVNNSIKNIAFTYKIVDKAIDYNNEIIVNMNSSCFILNYLGQEIKNQEGLAQPIGSNRFIVTNKAGKEFLINEKAEMIGEVTAAEYDEKLKLFVMDGKYYDLDLKLALDMNEVEYSYVCGNTDYKVYKDVTEDKDGDYIITYYILNGASMKKLDIAENATSFNAYNGFFSYRYTVEAKNYGESDKSYIVYCNINGEKIHSVETTSGDKYSNAYRYGDIIIIEVVTYESYSNQNVKYYIAK